MKQSKSINRINGAIANNATIEFYYSLGRAYDQYRDKWQNKSYNFIFGERKSNVSVSGNFIYGAAMRELELITCETGYNYSRDNRSARYELTYGSKTIDFSIRLNIDLIGITLEVSSYNYKPREYFFKRFKVRSNETFSQLDIVKYFESKILPMYFFAPGLFRNIQICYNLEKAQVIAKYKEMLEIWRRPTEIDIQKSWRQLFKKRFNVLLSDWEQFSDAKLNHMLNTFTWSKVRAKVCKAPSVFELLDRCSSVADTDEGIENEYYNIMETEYKNTILV